MSEATQVTPGPWEFRKDKQGDWRIYANGQSIMCGIEYYPWVPEEEGDWLLIAEAGTVHHETGLTPRQLVEQRDALYKALRILTREYIFTRTMDGTSAEDCETMECVRSARAALALVKGEQK